MPPQSGAEPERVTPHHEELGEPLWPDRHRGLAIGNMTASARRTIEEPGTNVAAKSGLNRSILEQTCGTILGQLRFKAEWAGGQLVEVDPRNNPLPDYGTFQCAGCGLVRDRDYNAALNILAGAFGPDHQ